MWDNLSRREFIRKTGLTGLGVSTVGFGKDLNNQNKEVMISGLVDGTEL